MQGLGSYCNCQGLGGTWEGILPVSACEAIRQSKQCKGHGSTEALGARVTQVARGVWVCVGGGACSATREWSELLGWGGEQGIGRTGATGMPARRSPERGDKKVASADTAPVANGNAGGVTTEQMLTEAVKVLPASIQGAAAAAIPAIVGLLGALQACMPYIAQAWDLCVKFYELIKPYEGVQTMLFGFVLVFFGGTYITTIAAWEAFKMCGYDKTRACIEKLYASYTVAKAASDKDDLKDDDGDGVPDVQQIDAKTLVQRKATLLLKTLDPDEVSDAIAGVWGGFMGVVAVLRIQFAQAVTLGSALGNTLNDMSKETVQPQLEALVDPDYKKWVAPVLRYGIKSAAVTIAFFIQRVMSSFHSATRGSQMMLKGAKKQLTVMGKPVPAILEEKNPNYKFVATGLAVLGFVLQLYMGFGVPFPLNLLLLPVTMLEHFLMMFVTY